MRVAAESCCEVMKGEQEIESAAEITAAPPAPGLAAFTPPPAAFSPAVIPSGRRGLMPSAVAALQRTAGNAAVGRMLQRETAAELIERRSGVFGFDERRLAADLRTQPSQVVLGALDALAKSDDDDDVAYGYMAGIPSQPGEPALAREDRRALERLRA
jgi:hypothetical protein